MIGRVAAFVALDSVLGGFGVDMVDITVNREVLSTMRPMIPDTEEPVDDPE
ncbi:hypothetical protein [Acidithiobacillus ferrianus]|uniref:hypothetical protein n=1 Tax=Acidithiobacillus ferrianus TaxID=2678518 RepID=UPI0034E60D0E